MATTSTQLLTVTEAADFLAVLPARLHRWTKAGSVPCVVLPDGEFRFTPSDLEAWISEKRQCNSTEGQK